VGRCTRCSHIGGVQAVGRRWSSMERYGWWHVAGQIYAQIWSKIGVRKARIRGICRNRGIRMLGGLISWSRGLRQGGRAQGRWGISLDRDGSRFDELGKGRIGRIWMPISIRGRGLRDMGRKEGLLERQRHNRVIHSTQRHRSLQSRSRRMLMSRGLHRWNRIFSKMQELTIKASASSQWGCHLNRSES